MPLRLLLVGLFVPLLACPSAAQDARPTPEQLAAQSKLVVVGKVEAYGLMDLEEDDGSKSKYVSLMVKIEAIESGAGLAKVGDTIQVICRVTVRPAPDGTTGGHDVIPSLGGRARFFLSGETLGVWSPIEPNGVERLDETPALTFPLEPDAPRPRRGLRLPWSFSLAVAGVVVLLLAVAYFRFRPAGSVGRPQADQPR